MNINSNLSSICIGSDHIAITESMLDAVIDLTECINMDCIQRIIASINAHK